MFYSDTQDSARTFSALYPDLSSGSALGEFKWDNRFFYIFNIFASRNPKVVTLVNQIKRKYAKKQIRS